MAAQHIQLLQSLTFPKPGVDYVHNEECTQCFDSQDDERGVDVCLTCFNGGCLSEARHHARSHFQKHPDHRFTVNIRRRRKEANGRDGQSEPPAKITKLEVVPEREEDKYTKETTLRFWGPNATDGQDIDISELGDQAERARSLITAVVDAKFAARSGPEAAWGEEELAVCEHTLLLEQLQRGSIPAEGLAKCQSCDITTNLWLCLTCGALGCGRPQYGMPGAGNGHALAHFNTHHSLGEEGHAACVKLGTITPEGNADIYCYACDEPRLDPELAAHLGNFGINVAGQKKTEKSLAELQIEQNLAFDFSLTAEDGSALEPVFGPGKTGLANLGNSCYMASVVQTLFSLLAFQSRYYDSGLSKAEAHWAACREALPAECIECQMLKVADGLLSGRYAKPDPNVKRPPANVETTDAPLHPAPADASPALAHQAGVRPAGLKRLIGAGHAEFSSMRQQDAEEFLGHLLTKLRRSNHAQASASGVFYPLACTGTSGSRTSAMIGSEEPTEIFAFGVEQRLQCGNPSCGGVRYRVDTQDVLSVAVPAVEVPAFDDKDGEIRKAFAPIELTRCIGDVLGKGGEERLEGWECPGCGQKSAAFKQVHMATFPEVLVVHAKKFQLVNWVPTKLDVPVILPHDDTLTLDTYLGHGLQPGEKELADTPAVAAQPQFDAEVLAQLEGMGFPAVRCQRALLATGNIGAEAAMEWLFGHMDDPDIDAPLDLGGASGGAAPSGSEPSEEQIAMLVSMGFTHAQARKALRETGGDTERAVDWVFSHPDDTGEDTAPAPASSGVDFAKPAAPGTTDLPARYRLKAFVSHKGPSVHSGHYVAHVRAPGLKVAAGTGGEGMDVDKDEEGWVLFNDEKVVKADVKSVDELKRLAYMYVFERV
ncbi:ubiquitinyl hydrolase [Coniophora puteana RWD-64-598 SS2]|uniref:Ubiquitin carboxyl-terminal hydrolase n=1 Tax=Coniophora puteana (strain RWD-64-598) TaxID=741705 RepID=A0A5M3M983_CONPW|nr:ubiquitinyl hydrolase [Coniophora puteana RWD-64-598 SS2]EIW75842.1 ubiquitinyl hydrolase [Coniophora puteana RWD-64-598 SS2]